MRLYLQSLCLAFLALGPSAGADGPDDPIRGELSVGLFRSDAFGTDASGSLSEMNIGTFGFRNDGGTFLGILSRRDLIPLLQSNLEIGGGYDEEAGETNSLSLNSRFGIFTKSYFKWTDGSGIYRSGSDVGAGVFIQLDDNEILNGFDDYYLAVSLRTNSLIGRTTYPGEEDDRLTGVWDLDAGVSMPVGETALIRLRYEQIRSWIGAQDGRVFEHSLSATLSHESVDFYAKVQAWKFQGKGRTELRIGVQFTDLLPKLIPRIFPTSKELAKRKRK